MPEGLRKADTLINELKENYSKDKNDIFPYLLRKIQEKDKNGIYKYYLGVRNNKVILYYLGSKIGEIYINGQKGRRKIHFDIDRYYLGNKEKDNAETFDEYRNALEDPEGILKRAEEYAYGRRKDVNEDKQKTHYEKICQQWIINSNNSNPNSKWYYADMEYTDGVLPREKRFGRFDLIAVRKEKIKDKYPVALIELKVGKKAFSGGKTTGNSQEKKEKIKKAYMELKKDLYTDPLTIYPVRFGSGMVSHVADFLRYLNSKEELYIERLKKEIIYSIKSHQGLGVLDNELFKNIKESDLSDRPDVYFALFTTLPKELRKGSDGTFTESLKDIKEYCYHYLYVSKGYSLPDSFRINPENKGFLDPENIEKMRKISECDDNNKLVINQPIKDEKYRFTFKFIDPDNKDEKAWDILNNGNEPSKC